MADTHYKHRRSCFVFLAYSVLASLDIYYEYRPTEPELPPIIKLANRVPLSGDFEEKSVSANFIRSRMVHVLTVSNVNNAALTELTICLQLPESLIESGIVFTGVKGLECRVSTVLYKPPFRFFPETNTLTLDFASNEPSGAKQIAFDPIPPHEEVTFRFVTAIGDDGGEFPKLMTKAGETTKGLITYFVSSWCGKGIATATVRSFIPLEYNATNRAMTLMTPIPFKAANDQQFTNVVLMKIGYGYRVPGLFRYGMYVTLLGPRPGAEGILSSMMMNESDNGRIFMGRSGSPDYFPSFLVQSNDGSAVCIGLDADNFKTATNAMDFLWVSNRVYPLRSQ
jgi:hypothetical protein